MVEGKITLVIHGGAGTILRENLSPEMREKYLAGLNDSLLAGYTLLKQGGSALDAVEAAVNSMEDDYLFNAGKGAVFTKGGKNELEASIMDGSNLKAGACTLLTTVKNPISLARQVMVQSPHNFLGGEAAEQLAKKSGLDIVEPKYFFTEHRWKQHLSGLESPGNEPPAPSPKGTVGAVALDQFGNIATATSTGGKTNKWDGRIGDTPMIGAGTYADNETCGVSGTGDGEFFIRHSVAYNVCARMKHLGESVEIAAGNVVEELRSVHGVGGVIALDRNGNVAMPFNSDGMYRGYIKNDGIAHTHIFNDE